MSAVALPCDVWEFQHTDGREFASRNTYHGQVTDLATSSQIEEGQSYDTDLLV